MFKVVLSLICLILIFKASTVEAGSISSSENQINLEDTVLSQQSCRDVLVNSANRFTTKSTEVKKDALLERIHLIESQADMEKQGYHPRYIAGLDNVKTNLQIAHSLRQRFSDSKNLIDFEKAHIPEFSYLIDSHIDFIERGIRSQNFSDKITRLNQLNQLRYEARSAKKAEQITYRWWLKFNLRLAILATPQKHRYTNGDYFGYYFENKWTKTDRQNTSYNNTLRIMEDGLNTYLKLKHHQFPKKILIPIMKGNLGIMSINRTYGTRVHLIGLVNTAIEVHDTLLSPIRFFRHDLSHADGIDVDTNLFFNLFIQKLMHLSKLERERVELIFFELTHEFRSNLLKTNLSIQEIVEQKINIDPKNYKESDFLPFIPVGHNHTYKDVNNFLQQAKSDFIRFFSEVQAEFNSAEATGSL